MMLAASRPASYKRPLAFETIYRARQTEVYQEGTAQASQEGTDTDTAKIAIDIGQAS